MNETTLKAARILIVDDEIPNACAVSNFLNRLGFNHVRSLNDSTLVFSLIETFEPDLLLLDLSMPNIDGFQILEEIKKNTSAGFRTFPTLVLTGDATAKNKRRALIAGATDLLAKPFDSSEFIMRVRNLLEAHFLQMELEEQNRLLDRRVAERTQRLEETLSELKTAQDHILKQQRLHAFAEMAGGVVHDFANSLMSIIGFSQVILDKPATLDDKTASLDYLRIINTAGRDASHVVNRLRDFYRPRNEGDHFEALDLNRIIGQAVELTQPKWKNKTWLENDRKISIETVFEEIPCVNGNAADMRQAISNLIFNAVDAMPRGGAITFYTYADEDDVIFEVHDNGSGMSAEVRNRCLEPFFSTKGDKGTGFGLSMVFGVIQRHEGELEIESEPGKGTTFRIRLPYVMPEEGEGNEDNKTTTSLAPVPVMS